jgi:hypothetical protein
MKNIKARLWAEAAARWEARLKASRDFIGPRIPLHLRLVRTTPLPPREYGRARMEQWFKQQFRTPLGKDGDLMHSVDVMRMHFDDIFSIIDETIADDDKAGLLMLTIYYALGTAEGHGRTEGRRELEAREREKSRATKLGGDVRGEQQQDEAAEWRNAAWPIWWEKRGQFPKSVRRREMPQEKLAHEILDELKGKVPGLPKYDQILWTIKNVWEAKQRAC